MFENDYFAQRRSELGMEREDELKKVQEILDSWYPKMAKAKRFHQGTLMIVCYNSPVASEIRMRQVELLEKLNLNVLRLQITIVT